MLVYGGNGLCWRFMLLVVLITRSLVMESSAVSCLCSTCCLLLRVFFQRVMTVFPAQQKKMLYYLFLWRTSGKHFSIGERGEREGSSGEDGLLADLVLDLQCQI